MCNNVYINVALWECMYVQGRDWCLVSLIILCHIYCCRIFHWTWASMFLLIFLASLLQIFPLSASCIGITGGPQTSPLGFYWIWVSEFPILILVWQALIKIMLSFLFRSTGWSYLSTWYDLESTSWYVWEGISRDLSISATSILPDTSLQFLHSSHVESKPEVLQESSGLQHRSGIAKAFRFVDWAATGFSCISIIWMAIAGLSRPYHASHSNKFLFIIHNIYMHFIASVHLENIA